MVFNKDIPPEAPAVVEAVVTEANEELFRRGVPQGADDADIGRITAWNVDGKILHLAIESGPYTRSHDALMRFRKVLVPKMGKEFHLGMRSIEVESFTITAEGEIPDAAIPKLPMITGTTRTEDGVVFTLALDAGDLENKVPDRIVRLLEDKIEETTYGGKTEHWELLYESPKRNLTFDKNPSEEMEKLGWIKHGMSRGQWIFGPKAASLVRVFEQIAIEEIIKPLGFSEMIFPKLVPWDVWMHSGHAKGVYPEIYYVCTPKSRDPAYWEEVTDYYKVTGEVPIDMIRERIDGPIGGMCYAQCPPFWPFVQGETLGNDCLPLHVFDRSGTSHRYESGGIHGIERVDEFHRIEVLWLGTAEQTVATADKLHEAYLRVFDEILELEWRCAKVTPWFMAQEGLAGLSDTERVGTRDYEAILPYNGDWLEFQNVSINGNKYPKGFNVKIQSGEECWSGCSGIGLERWTASFLAQKGFDKENWPEGVTRRYEEPENVFTFL